MFTHTHQFAVYPRVDIASAWFPALVYLFPGSGRLSTWRTHLLPPLPPGKREKEGNDTLMVSAPSFPTRRCVSLLFLALRFIPSLVVLRSFSDCVCFSFYLDSFWRCLGLFEVVKRVLQFCSKRLRFFLFLFCARASVESVVQVSYLSRSTLISFFRALCFFCVSFSFLLT